MNREHTANELGALRYAAGLADAMSPLEAFHQIEHARSTAAATAIAKA